MDDYDGDKELICNISFIKALLQFSSIADQNKIQEWLTKIQEDNNGLCDVKAKNEYLLYLLINLQKGILLHPFNKLPPSGKLKTLCKILPEHIYEDLEKQLRLSYCRLKRMLNASNENFEMPDLKCKPSNFHSEQPRPRKGVTASFAVFSNYDDND